MARKALGRGLDALLPGSEGATAKPGLVEIDIDRIRPNPHQPRETFEPESLEAIARSLQERGMLQPVVVRRTRDGFELIAGERRWRAAQRAGIGSIPAVVRDVTPEESLELALIENVQRQDLNPIEEAQAYRYLVDDVGLTQEQVAERVGRDRSTVSNYLRLLKLPEAVQALIVDGKLSMGHARAILGLEDAAAQRRLAEEVVGKDLSVRQTESRVRRGRRKGRGGGRKDRDPDVEAAEQRLAEHLGTRVRIRGKEKGRIEIRFTSLGELERLYEVLLGR